MGDFKVGDRVCFSPNNNRGTLVFIKGDEVLVDFDSFGLCLETTQFLKRLVKKKRTLKCKLSLAKEALESIEADIETAKRVLKKI